jgi:hypothetical protein
MISEDEGLNIWRQALQHPFGIAIKTDNRFNLTQRLYQIRARHKDEDFSGLMLANAPDQSEVWVIHRPVQKPIKPMSEEDLDDL